MELELLQSEPKLKEARHKAKAILKTANIVSPAVNLNTIYHLAQRDFNLIIQGANATVLPTNVDGITKRDGDEVFILYNESVSVARQRFTVAHELGHLYLGHVHGGSSIDLGTKNFDEIEANQFAAHLLIPPLFLRKDIKAGQKDPKELAKIYQVSEQALWWQIDKAGLLNLF